MEAGCKGLTEHPVHNQLSGNIRWLLLNVNVFGSESSMCRKELLSIVNVQRLREREQRLEETDDTQPKPGPQKD